MAWLRALELDWIGHVDLLHCTWSGDGSPLRYLVNVLCSYMIAGSFSTALLELQADPFILHSF